MKSRMVCANCFAPEASEWVCCLECGYNKLIEVDVADDEV